MPNCIGGRLDFFGKGAGCLRLILMIWYNKLKAAVLAEMIPEGYTFMPIPVEKGIYFSMV